MDLKILDRLCRQGTITLKEALERTALDELDPLLHRLKRHAPAKALCAALQARIAKAPLDQFETLKHLYFRHCTG
jgi:hypothetical protein